MGIRRRAVPTRLIIRIAYLTLAVNERMKDQRSSATPGDKTPDKAALARACGEPYLVF
jgi:hypothetical protein